MGAASFLTPSTENLIGANSSAEYVDTKVIGHVPLADITVTSIVVPCLLSKSKSKETLFKVGQSETIKH